MVQDPANFQFWQFADGENLRAFLIFEQMFAFQIDNIVFRLRFCGRHEKGAERGPSEGSFSLRRRRNRAVGLQAFNEAF